MSQKLFASALVVLTLLGGWSIHGFSVRNGFYQTMTDYKDKLTLHDGAVYTESFTGISPIDDLLATLLTFFWPVLDSSTPELSLTSFLFAGQFTAAWTITMIEGMRAGNAWRLPSYTTIAGLMVQTMGAALVIPAWTALHLFTSPTLTDTSPAALSVPESALRALPYSIALGFIAPSVAMALPVGVISQQTKIYAVCVWQAFPLWTQIFQMILQYTVFADWASRSSRSDKGRNATQLRLLRRCYKFALYLAMASQVASGTLTLAAYVAPHIFESSFVVRIQPENVFVPPSPFGDHKVLGIPEGAFRFIQFDFMTTSAAYFVWGLAVKYSMVSGRSIGGLISDLVLRPTSLGYMAAGLTSVWDRDEAVFGGEEALAMKDKKAQ